MTDFNIERCAEYVRQLIAERYPRLEDRAIALVLQIQIGTAFSCDEAPSIDPADPMLPGALRILADSLEYKPKMILQEEDITVGSKWD